MAPSAPRGLLDAGEQYQTLRSVSDHHVFVICRDGRFTRGHRGNIRSCRRAEFLGWLLFFSCDYFSDEWEEPLLAIAAILISLKLVGFILASIAALVVKSYRWL